MGHIEATPLPDQLVEVIISNCVINPSGDEAAVLAESLRILRAGGRVAVFES
jgi:arsenite methyltransferase